MDKQEINNAITEHAIWKYSLNNIIRTGKLETSIEGYKECAFGKWFYGPTILAGEKSSMHFKKVEELHIELHEIAAKIANLASNGEKEEAEKLLGFEGEFDTTSCRLIEAMMKWKNDSTCRDCQLEERKVPSCCESQGKVQNASVPVK